MNLRNTGENKTKIIEYLPNGAFLVSMDCYYYSLSTSSNNYGNIELMKRTKYNIMQEDRSLVCFDWFDTYKINSEGDCIVGYLKNVLDYERILEHFDLSQAGPKIEERDGHRHLINGLSIKELIPEKYKYSYGLINKNLEFSIRPIYDGLEFAGENCSIAAMYNNYETYGYINNLTGEQITPICFSEAYPFSEGLARIRYHHATAFISKDKKVINPNSVDEYAFNPIYGEATDFCKGLSKVVENNDFTYYINKEGKYVSKPHIRKRKI